MGHQSRGRQPSSAHTVFVYPNKYTNKDALDLYLHFYVRWANRISRTSWNCWMNSNFKHIFHLQMGFYIFLKLKKSKNGIPFRFRKNLTKVPSIRQSLLKYQLFKKMFTSPCIFISKEFCWNRIRDRTHSKYFLFHQKKFFYSKIQQGIVKILKKKMKLDFSIMYLCSNYLAV